MKKASDIKPLHDYILIEPLEEEEKTAAGIYLPESAKEKPTIGIVRAIGPGRTDKSGKRIKISVKIGDKVYYKKWGGSEVKIKGKEWLLVEEKDILATLR
jgi:chaperonin GroES